MNVDLYEDILKILDMLADKGKVSDREGRKIFGDGRWENIRGWFETHTGKKFIIFFGSLDALNPSDIEAARETVQSEIKRLREEERSQKLADHNNLSGTLANWATFFLALWGALTGTVALLMELFSRR